MSIDVNNIPLTVIRPRRGWYFFDFREFWLYRELQYFLVWRDVKVRYKQTALGVAWAILQPLLTMIIFSIILGRLAGLNQRTGGVPYSLFVLSGLVLWDQYFFDYTTIGQKRIAVLIHALAAIVIICTWIVHVYAAIWVRGTIPAMVKGTVTGGWAWRHHRKWLRELIGDKSGGRGKGAKPAK